MMASGCTPAGDVHFEWRWAAELPGDQEHPSIGVAGAINGVTEGAFIIAGGSNFPEAMPWEGGKKAYSDKVHVLLAKGGRYVWDKEVTGRLPEKIAYCGYTSTRKGIVYAGGENESGIRSGVFLLQWDSAENSIRIKPLPDLPEPLTNVSLTHLGDVVYAVGGDRPGSSSDGFYRLDLKDQVLRWDRLPPLPQPLANCIAAVQENGTGSLIYVIGGRTRTSSGISLLHHTVYAFDPVRSVWKKMSSISDGKNTINLSAAPGLALGHRYVVVFGGDDGVVFRRIETLMAERSRSSAQAEKARLSRAIRDLDVHHKGFYRGILLYDTRENSWSEAGTLPFAAHVTTSAVSWDGKIIIADGEIRPGVRSAEVMVATWEAGSR